MKRRYLMSYHSYRNIGFLFTDTEANCLKWRSLFSGYDPSRALRLLDTHVDEDILYIDYFRRPYRLHLKTGVLEKKDPGGWTPDLFMNEALVLYHILGDLKEQPVSAGEWVPEAALDPVRIRSGNRTDPLLDGFAADFSGRIAELKKACEQLGGTRLSQADLAYEFYPFRQTPLRLIFWDKDDEFPAQVQVLVDRNITDYMHFEAVGCMIADLFLVLDTIRSSADTDPSRYEHR